VIDRMIKKAEYAKAGIPRYWIVERDSVTAVHRHNLNVESGEYEPDPGGPQPIAWLLTTVPRSPEPTRSACRLAHFQK
jgi:Uma2 family endonuclease